MVSYSRCRFCRGAGCLACAGEREKDREMSFANPIVIDPTDPEDMADAKELLGAEAIEEAFQDPGEGPFNLQLNLLRFHLRQRTRRERRKGENG